ncbi:MAG: hypothetical protein MUF30_00120 [Burkholderiales bacterium]|jgi:hypothetical protein|nr:hypothetical protein [Burkholderiales bacterium]
MTSNRRAPLARACRRLAAIALALGAALGAASAHAAPDPNAALAQATALSLQHGVHHALEARWDGHVIVLCDDDAVRARRNDLRTRVCWGVAPAALGDAPAAGKRAGPTWSDGITLHCAADADACFHRGATWRGENKVLGLPPADSAHLYFDGPADVAARIRTLVLDAAATLRAAPTTPGVDSVAIVPLHEAGVAAVGEAAPVTPAAGRAATAGSTAPVVAVAEVGQPTYNRERAMLFYVARGCRWTEEMGRYAFACIRDHGGFNAHWCHDETMQVYCSEDR